MKQKIPQITDIRKENITANDRKQDSLNFRVIKDVKHHCYSTFQGI